MWKEIPEEDHLKGRLVSNREVPHEDDENTEATEATTADVDEEQIDPELLIDEDGEPVFILEKVLSRKSIRSTFHYLRRRKMEGIYIYSDKDNSWITRKMAMTCIYCGETTIE